MSFAAEDFAELDAVLHADIPWESYMTARLITERDLSLIRRFDKKSDEVKQSILDESGSAYTEAFLSVLKNVTKEDTVQYVLALLVKVLASEPHRARLFHTASESHVGAPVEPTAVFLRLLQRSDWFTQEKACKLLACILASRPDRGSGRAEASTSNGVTEASPAESALAALTDWIGNQLKRPSHPTKGVPTAVNALAILLSERGARALCLRAGVIDALAPLLKQAAGSPTSSQLLYEICLSLWNLSFTADGAKALGKAGVVKPLVEVCKSAQKEKVFRVALSCLRNLLNHPDLALAGDMVDGGLTKCLATRALATWGDSDIPALIADMQEHLKTGIQVLSSFEKYRAEVLSGQLEWGPMHSSELFWRQNVDKFEEKDFQVLRLLLKLIEQSREAKTQAVGCNDLGMFITHHPQGRHIVSDLRGKELVMRLMTSGDPTVQKAALLTVQKIMLSRDKADFMAVGNAA